MEGWTPPNYDRRGETLPTYLMSTALECQRSDGPVHLAAPEQRAGYHSRAVQEREGLTAEQCKRGRGSQQSSAREGGAHSRAVQEREGLTAEQCKRGRGSQQSSAREGGAHSRAVQEREGLTAEQCKRGRGSQQSSAREGRAHFCLLYVLRSRTATTPSPELIITLPEGKSSSAEMPRLYLSFWGPKLLKRQVVMLTVRMSPVVVPQYITLSSSAT